MKGARAARLVLVGLAACVVLAATSLAFARPGGGGSFSGGSSSSGGGGGSSGGGGAAILEIILLCIQHPYIGIPIILIVVVFLVMKSRANKAKTAWVAGQGEGGSAGAPVVAAARTGARRALEGLRASDPNFSYVLFEDFLYALYTETHTARGQGQVQRMSAYLDAPVVAALAATAPALVENLVVGAMRFVGASGIGGGTGEAVVSVEFEANYTETPRTPGQGRPESYYVMERWSLARKNGVLSRTPERARVFGCPNCGAPQDHVMSGTCRHCGQVVSSGAFDWVVRNIQLLRRETRGPMLTGTTEEQGTNLPTILDPEANARLAAVQAKDPQFQFPHFQGRVGLVFTEFQIAWSARDLARMRPYLSDMLFMTQSYWVEAYKRQRLRNVTENARIVGLQLARVTSDKFYDAITVRLYAKSLDYTLEDGTNKVVGGSRSKERAYSEYWTFIRGTNRKGPARDRPCMPELRRSARRSTWSASASTAERKVTSGDFDWVLSRIEQDEVVRGVSGAQDGRLEPQVGGPQLQDGHLEAKFARLILQDGHLEE